MYCQLTSLCEQFFRSLIFRMKLVFVFDEHGINHARNQRLEINVGVLNVFDDPSLVCL